MTTSWNLHSDELSPWLDGVVNGQVTGFKFIYIFHQEICGTLRGPQIEDFKCGQTVRVRLRRNAHASPKHSSHHWVEEIEAAPTPPNVVYHKGYFISADMTPEPQNGGVPKLFNAYLGTAYDYDAVIPGAILADRRAVRVKLVIKRDEQDITHSRLQVVEYHGVAGKISGSPARGLIRRADQDYYYVWCFNTTDELVLPKYLVEGDDTWLGKWIVFDQLLTHQGRRQIAVKPRPVQAPCPTAYLDGVVKIKVNCRRSEMLGSQFPVYETEGAGKIVDSGNILRESELTFPRYLWIEPEDKVAGYKWRVAATNQEPETGPARQTRPSPSESDNYEDKPLIALCNAILENGDLCNQFKAIDPKLYTAFSLAVFTHDE